MYLFTIHVTSIGHFILGLPPFNFPQGGNGKPLLPPWGKVGKEHYQCLQPRREGIEVLGTISKFGFCGYNQ